MTHPTQSIAVDANVLINLLITHRLELFSRLPGFAYVVPDHVHQEITTPEQRAALDLALKADRFRTVSITQLNDIAFFAELTAYLGRGEAACLVLAVRNGWNIASDEKRRFRREAIRRIGSERILGTADLYVRAIRAGLITVEAADADKEILASRCFTMPFGSFRDRIPFTEEPGS